VFCHLWTAEELIHGRFKALALGADFVQLGRPMLWGLAHDGEKGARHVLKSLLADFDLTVGLSGHQNLSTVNRTAIVSSVFR